jgi:hypothetical protein
MAIQTKEIVFGSLGRCLELSNGTVDVVITLDFGPRIVRYGFTGKQNMFNEGPSFVTPGGYRFTGGHRLWHSPEDKVRSYEPDNDPVTMEIIDGGL